MAFAYATLATIVLALTRITFGLVQITTMLKTACKKEDKLGVP